MLAINKLANALGELSRMTPMPVRTLPDDEELPQQITGIARRYDDA
jgi:hypothetical protein